MASNTKRRMSSGSEDEDPTSKRPSVETTIPSNQPKFLILHSTDKTRPLGKLSPFYVNKVLQSLAGVPKKVQRLRSGDLLVETSSPQHSELLLRATALGETPITVTPHNFLNSSRGVISERDLRDCSEEELKEELSSQGVVAVRRIKFRRNSELMNSNTVVLTFNSPKLPASIKAGYLSCAVRPYIPNPVRCYNCQLFGHSKNACRGKPTCARCGEQEHIDGECPNKPHCRNCKGDHPAYDRNCPKWQNEKAIQKIKTLEGLSYPEAKKKTTPITTSGKSFADAVKQTRTIEVQTDLSVPPQDSFSGAAKYMLRPTTENASTQSPVTIPPSSQTTTTMVPRPCVPKVSCNAGAASKAGPKSSKPQKGDGNSATNKKPIKR